MDNSTTGIIIVDHGSRRAESNDMLEVFVTSFADRMNFPIVEAAHMELASPSIAEAFDRCVQRGAKQVVVCPYFLLPGRHWHEDIPNLTKAAASRHPGVGYMVTSPIGLHPMMHDVIRSRIEGCVEHAGGSGPECEACAGKGGCQLRTV